MLGSPNFIFDIYDGKTAPAATPASARPGSNKMTALYQSWFDDNQLLWDYSSFNGLSDYGPFLGAGIVADGLFSGADGVKTVEQRNRYNAMLGPGMGGTAGIRRDFCYHRACHRITNVNKFALDKLTQAAAHSIESLGQQSDLKICLYPIQQINKQSQEEQQFE
jgi:hypothetical protein